MSILSTAKKTVLSDFKDLEQKSIYLHASDEETDFQLFEQRRAFVEVNKKNCNVEVLCIKDVESNLQIQCLTTFIKENICCVACPKKSVNEIALGLSNGQIHLYNYKKKEQVHRFLGENIRDGILCLDYNASDEYVAAVGDNGIINIYGMMTKTKTDTINIDKASFLARFHPTKRLHLAIASLNGTVSVCDIHTKKILFNRKNAHKAPCRDLCIAANTPNILISAGFDCLLNIFDTRRQTSPESITFSHPLSTVATSECGTYFCIGNLKGEIFTYDMRKTSNHLAKKKVHGSAVNRIGFLRDRKDYMNTFDTVLGEQSTKKSIDPTDLMCSVSSMSSFELPLTEARMSVVGQESLDWDLQLKVHADSIDFFPPVPAVQEKLKSNLTILQNAGNINTRRGTYSVKHESIFPLRKSELSKITEEERNHCDKENRITGNVLNIRTPFKDTGKNSTPKNGMSPSISPSQKTLDPSAILELTSNISAPQQPDAITEQVNGENTMILNAIASLRTDMEKRLNLLESNILFNADGNKWNIFSQSFNLWRQQQQISEEIHFGISMLLQTDPFVNEFRRLQNEVDRLREELSKFAGEIPK